MLANLKEVLVPAEAGHYCVGHFDVLTLEMARAVIAAAEEADAPVILGIEESQLSICPLDEFAAFVLPMARKAAVPVAVHFDHGQTFARCIEALKLGFTSVNFDCSRDVLEVNAAKVSEMVRTAHAFGAAVEAELGHTPEAEELRSGAAELTDPAQAADYVKETGIDALAIAVGTAHGQYLETPKLDYNRIRAIAEAAKVPLVLHGGSGLSDTAIREAIASGISKIDIFTDINLACCQGAIQAYNDGIHTISEMIPYEEHAVRVVAAEKIRLFGNRT
ncbi:MAG: class II fructose-bisphosphate aldolase [Clostridiales bacterium]|jgi:fructose-bisphosphate aldolase class II|uniref:class II fructose-bisphosphate aldolase n=1 Tax=Chordicoccus furentiruminis TaxID=2709410 RepID=UPI0023A8E7DA|nr:class II fructose-bisphosphate aldolase [Chordicoccus furentiruminis]MCI6174147.1 class II fructose-bisphosphate aldolase [Clostridiales bacterium]